MPIVIPKLRSRALAHGRVGTQRIDRVQRLAAPLDLEPRHAVGIGAVAAREVHEVQVGELAGVMHGAPRAGDRRQLRGDHAVAQGLSERLAEER
jgi:hypothetical protein